MHRVSLRRRATRRQQFVTYDGTVSRGAANVLWITEVLSQANKVHRRLQPLIEPLFEPGSVHPADLQRRGSAFQRQRVVTVGVLHQLVDEVEVDDVRAMDADELTRIELSFEAAEDLAIEICLSRAV